MSSSSESSLSQSPPASPEASYHGPPSLERLVLHFVAAKRSLAATGHVYRANEFVTNSRALIEKIAAFNAKNAFGRNGLDDQVNTLDSIRDALVDDRDRVADEFEGTLATLDKAHSRLEKTLKTLRKTVVQTQRSQEQRHGQSESDGETSETTERTASEQKTLFHFIDEENHEALQSALRGLIDEYHIAKGDLDGNLQIFDNLLRSITNKLSDRLDESDSPDRPTIYDEPPPSIEELFHRMEEHATEMASNLQNLVQHYDLCITALKHTEGGGEAAKQAIQSAELTKGTPGSEESLYGKTVPEPISEEELTQMLDVIDKDSEEVEDVVTEISERGSDMESDYQQLSKCAKKTRQRNKTLRHVLTLMHDIRAAIPGHLEASAKFREIWQDISTSMQSKTKELVELSGFYEDFVSGYGRLLQEVERRRASEAQMKKIADRARREIEKIYEADQMARQEFVEEYGHVVPTDLGALHGLADRAPRWEIRAVEEGNESQGRLNDG
ncbi:hypothetical protein PRZ48_005986 [Zasmidium cellare]|uniref:Autophagy-related protein 17 n=1 Tax=Zasmidium cellare TaxID=395010 RepID=A0ABR0EN08_ZASCE|nr:hypothetical protein PRZ48_005986 [Zasmidium cellare]